MTRTPKITAGSALGIIGHRAARIASDAGRDLYWRDIAVKLEIWNRRHPLRLTALAKADDFNLAHDVFGILDRAIGAGDQFFRPRFSA